ncbi:MAG: geranylgeranylglycerol-phosphate geranylgeranyltransferase [Candidatus Marinimicrobia bacterium]|nr:geranylgeranylglycerol-phosphate geranylgeranyltransferase [Candidatus Neomarinimicrobiota bacterium]
MPAFLSILRPLNLLQATLAVILTAAFLDQLSQIETLAWLILSVITINGAGNIINDIYDIEIDKINRPRRPLPSGNMSLMTARVYMITLFMVGILFSSLISAATLLIAGLIAMPLLIAYSAWFKRLPLIGNITVSFMLGLTFVYVGSAFGAIQETIIMGALAFGFTFIREIVKDLEDQEGDREVNAKTLPLIWGESATINFTLLLMVVFIVLDLFPYIFGAYNELYLWLVIIGINFPILICAIILWRFPAKNNFARIQLFLKLNIFIGLAALYLGRPI